MAENHDVRILVGRSISECYAVCFTCHDLTTGLVDTDEARQAALEHLIRTTPQRFA